MDIYILDADLNKTGIIDDYEEFIWTERFASEGDFELKVKANRENRNKYTNGLRLSINGSNRVMIVEEIFDSEDDDGTRTLLVTGPSYEQVLRTRVAQGDITDLLHSSVIRNEAMPPMPDENVNEASGGWSFKADPDFLTSVEYEGGPGLKSDETWMKRYATKSKTTKMEIWPFRADKKPTLKGFEYYRIGIWAISSKNTNVKLTATTTGSPGLPVYESPVTALVANEWKLVEIEQAPTAKGPYTLDLKLIQTSNMAYASGDFIGATGCVITNSRSKELYYFDGDSSNHPNYTDTWWEYDTQRSPSIAEWQGLPEWRIKDKPAEVARKIVNDICVLGTANENDIMDNLDMNNIYPADDIPESDVDIEEVIKPKPVYDAVKDICDRYGMGFRMVRCPDCKRIKFNVYTGSDRSQDVVFSNELENFTNSSTLKSTYDFRNVAYVYSPAGFKEVIGPDASESDSGYTRRVLMVDADHIHIGEDRIDEKLERAGMEALYEHNSVHAVDGEVPPNQTYIYDSDYHLGDLVTVVGPDGSTDKMRVTEYIFISDSEGVRSYPTLSTEDKITPGTWYSAEWNIYWQDAVGEWGTIE